MGDPVRRRPVPAPRLLALLSALAMVSAGCLAGLPAGPTNDAPDLPGSPEAGLQVLHDQRLGPADQSAMEVSIAANPTDPSHLVAASNLRAEGHRGYGIYVSRDAGETWWFRHFDPEDAGRTTGDQPRFNRLSDPVVAFDQDGTLYLSGLGVLPTSGIFLAKSYDGGRTFAEVHVVEESDPATDFNDKEWFAISPATGTIVMAWQKEPLIDSLRSVDYATGLDVDVGNVVVSVSRDRSRTWTEPVEVDRGMHNNGTQVAFTPDGTAHMVWVNYEEGTLDYVRSTDDGETWSDPVPVAEVHVVGRYDEYQRMHTLPGLAAGPNGKLVAVWHDSRNGDADVYAVASDLNGTEREWGFEVRVHADEPGNGAIQLYPWVDIGADGRVHVSYYASTNDSDSDDPRLQYVHTWAPPVDIQVLRDETSCAPDGSVCATLRAVQWNNSFAHPATPVSSEPFEFFGRNGILGDYTGVVANELGVFPAWADGRTDTVGIHAARVLLDG